jgi:hypothetical protein
MNILEQEEGRGWVGVGMMVCKIRSRRSVTRTQGSVEGAMLAEHVISMPGTQRRNNFILI